MKQFWLTLAAVAIGGFLALLGYDRFVLKPREAARSTQAALAPAAAPKAEPVQADVSKAREEAKQVADEVDASVQRSVDKVRDVMEAQADDMNRRASIGSAVSRATMFRVTLTEYYQSNGRWPRTADDASLPSPEEMRGNGVDGVELGHGGAVIVHLDKSLSANGRIALRPKASADTDIVDWRCEIERDAGLKPFLPHCEPVR
jgi:hypothetical protein